ncbi:hypothetical protein PsorP6_007794 [Peronosclerospora sorghi]|uniref:Uncharacterized protein n=1 Tax=Peronosclerospora sorghi TaxID=230839 RepID=A0ACC0WBH0_9STRA|nr:hypothetical protein PsorP6_007794 [Peronosclerospora sorghi]
MMASLCGMHALFTCLARRWSFWLAAVDGVPALSNDVDGVCGGCASGKMSADQFQHTSGSVLKRSSPFEVVHSDGMGPIIPPSRVKCLTASRKKKRCGLDSTRTVDQYVSKEFNSFCVNASIIRQTSAPYLPQQNGLSERMNRTLTEDGLVNDPLHATRSMLIG